VPILTSFFSALPSLAQWAEATPRALSYSNNTLLNPGLSTSKPYPLNSTGTVSFQSIPIPGTLPQKNWYVFTPPAGNISGGYIYYPGELSKRLSRFSSRINQPNRGMSKQGIATKYKIVFSHGKSSFFLCLGAFCMRSFGSCSRVHVPDWCLGNIAHRIQSSQCFEAILWASIIRLRLLLLRRVMSF
jgi:hypothetical protein